MIKKIVLEIDDDTNSFYSTFHIQGPLIALSLMDFDQELRNISKYQEDTKIDSDKVRDMLRECLTANSIDVELLLG